MSQQPLAHRPPRPKSPAGDPFYRRPAGTSGAAQSPPTGDHDHSHDRTHDHSHDHTHDHTHAAVEARPGHHYEHHREEVPHHHHGEGHHHHEGGDAPHEHRGGERPGGLRDLAFSDEKRLIDAIVSLVAERVEEIVQRRVEEIVSRHLGGRGNGPSQRGPGDNSGHGGGRR
jgi:hypothetical protein